MSPTLETDLAYPVIQRSKQAENIRVCDSLVQLLRIWLSGLMFRWWIWSLIWIQVSFKHERDSKTNGQIFMVLVTKTRPKKQILGDIWKLSRSTWILITQNSFMWISFHSILFFYKRRKICKWEPLWQMCDWQEVEKGKQFVQTLVLYNICTVTEFKIKSIYFQSFELLNTVALLCLVELNSPSDWTPHWGNYPKKLYNYST